MLSFSPEKLFIVALIALIVLGPGRLPEAARTAGRFVATIRRLSSGLQDEMNNALAEPREAFNSAVHEFRPPVASRSLLDTISNLNTPHPEPGWHEEDGRHEEPPAVPPTPAAAARESSGLGFPDDPSVN